MIMTAYKGKLCTKLKTYYDKYRKELMDDSLKKQEQDIDPFVREKTLNEQLELITKMAQDLDKEHRKLKNQEQRLKIQYSSQEKDHELLIKQIIYFKKQQKSMKEDLLRTKEEIEKNKKEEEQQDRILASKLDKKQPDSSQPNKLQSGKRS